MWQPRLCALRATSPASPWYGGHKPPSCRPWRQNVGFLCCFWPFPKSLEMNFRFIHDLFIDLGTNFVSVLDEFYGVSVPFFEHVFWLLCFLVFHRCWYPQFSKCYVLFT